MVWTPKYTITKDILADLTRIEQIKNSFHSQAISPFLLSSLHQSAKIAQTHYSTRIEGNNLSLQQVEQTLHSANHDAKKYQGHDQKEVRSYYNAIDYMEKYLEEGAPFTESFIQKIHTLIEGQKKTIPYRDSQNAIYDSSDGSLVYLPPETQDVPTMMRDLTIWVNENITQLPTPIMAGLFHYQFVTIHPYFDGNGRTARLITSYLMRKFGYGLQGIYSLEEYYAQNLGEYYQALATHPHHNYYFGRDKADLSNWLAYFIRGVAQAFTKVIAHAEQISCPDTTAVSSLWRNLDIKQRQILELFAEYAAITSAQAGNCLGITSQSARLLLNKWVASGFLQIASPAKKNRAYRLSTQYEALVARSKS